MWGLTFNGNEMRLARVEARLRAWQQQDETSQRLIADQFSIGHAAHGRRSGNVEHPPAAKVAAMGAGCVLSDCSGSLTFSLLPSGSYGQWSFLLLIELRVVGFRF